MTGARRDHHLRPASSLASAWGALCRLPAADPWLWLGRAPALETAAALCVVLLDRLPGLLVALGAEVFGHG